MSSRIRLSFFLVSFTLNIIFLILIVTLICKNDIRELSGYWCGMDNRAKVYGFQFQHSDDFGYHTVVKIEESKLGDITKIGFYDLKDNLVHFQFKQSIAPNGTISNINELEEWSTINKDNLLILYSKDTSVKITLKEIAQ